MFPYFGVFYISNPYILLEWHYVQEMQFHLPKSSSSSCNQHNISCHYQSANLLMEFFNVNCQAHIKRTEPVVSGGTTARISIPGPQFQNSVFRKLIVVDRSFLAWKFFHNNNFNGLNSFVMMIGTWSTRATESSGYLLLPSRIFKSKFRYIKFFLLIGGEPQFNNIPKFNN